MLGSFLAEAAWYIPAHEVYWSCLQVIRLNDVRAKTSRLIECGIRSVISSPSNPIWNILLCSSSYPPYSLIKVTVSSSAIPTHLDWYSWEKAKYMKTKYCSNITKQSLQYSHCIGVLQLEDIMIYRLNYICISDNGFLHILVAFHSITRQIMLYSLHQILSGLKNNIGSIYPDHQNRFILLGNKLYMKMTQQQTFYCYIRDSIIVRRMVFQATILHL